MVFLYCRNELCEYTSGIPSSLSLWISSILACYYFYNIVLLLMLVLLLTALGVLEKQIMSVSLHAYCIFFSFVQCSRFTEKKVLKKDKYCILFSLSSQVATDKVAGKLSSTLSWVKNTVSHTVSQMASQVASPSASLHTTSSSTTLSTPALSPSSPTQLSPDDLELLAKLEEQNR